MKFVGDFSIILALILVLKNVFATQIFHSDPESMMAKIIDEDWNDLDPKIIHYQIKKIFMVMKKKSSKVQVPDDDDANLKNIENFIESFIQIKNSGSNSSKFSSSEQQTWAENALGDQGFNKSFAEMIKMIIGAGPDNEMCVYSRCYSQPYAGSILQKISER